MNDIFCLQTWQNRSNSWRLTTRDAVTESPSRSTFSHTRRRYICFTHPSTTETYLFIKMYLYRICHLLTLNVPVFSVHQTSVELNNIKLCSGMCTIANCITYNGTLGDIVTYYGSSIFFSLQLPLIPLIKAWIYPASNEQATKLEPTYLIQQLNNKAWTAKAVIYLDIEAKIYNIIQSVHLLDNGKITTKIFPDRT